VRGVGGGVSGVGRVVQKIDGGGVQLTIHTLMSLILI
jgi:hypothetical protein